MSLYKELKAAGIETDNHESDLYVKDSPEAREIVHRHRPEAPRAFRSEVDGEIWLDVPFAFEPFWDAKARHEQR